MPSYNPYSVDVRRNVDLPNVHRSTAVNITKEPIKSYFQSWSYFAERTKYNDKLWGTIWDSVSYENASKIMHEVTVLLQKLHLMDKTPQEGMRYMLCGLQVPFHRLLIDRICQNKTLAIDLMPCSDANESIIHLLWMRLFILSVLIKKKPTCLDFDLIPYLQKNPPTNSQPLFELQTSAPTMAVIKFLYYALIFTVLQRPSIHGPIIHSSDTSFVLLFINKSVPCVDLTWNDLINTVVYGSPIDEQKKQLLPLPRSPANSVYDPPETSSTKPRTLLHTETSLQHRSQSLRTKTSTRTMSNQPQMPRQQTVKSPLNHFRGPPKSPSSMKINLSSNIPSNPVIPRLCIPPRDDNDSVSKTEFKVDDPLDHLKADIPISRFNSISDVGTANPRASLVAPSDSLLWEHSPARPQSLSPQMIKTPMHYASSEHPDFEFATYDDRPVTVSLNQDDMDLMDDLKGIVGSVGRITEDFNKLFETLGSPISPLSEYNMTENDFSEVFDI